MTGDFKSTFYWSIWLNKRTWCLHLCCFTLHKKIISSSIRMKSWSNWIVFRCLHSLWDLFLYFTRWLNDLWNQIFSLLLCIFIMLSFFFNLLSFSRDPFLKLIFLCWSYSWTHLSNFILMLFDSHLYYLFSYLHLFLKILGKTILK